MTNTDPDPVAQVQAMAAQLLEATHTQSRPMSLTELWYAIARRGGGMADPGTVIPLVCTGDHLIDDNDVVLACAALRLRYPLLASSKSFIGEPRFVVNTPLTYAHAIRMAREQVEFQTFDDHDAATLALRNRWLAFDPDDALDVRVRSCAFVWARDADPKSGKYVLGIISSHSVTDNRRRLNLVRRFLELLSAPGQSKAELDAHFAGKRPPAPIPPSTEQLKPKLSDDEAEATQAKTVFDNLVVQHFGKPMSGIVADGSANPPWTPRMLRKVWSAEETTRILQACKEHGVTITHLVNVAGALSSLQNGDKPCGAVSAPDQDDDAFYFEYMQPIDVTAKIPEQADRAFNGSDMDVACRVELYPVLLRVPRTQVAQVWEVARLFKQQNDAFVQSPYFWRMLPMYLSLVPESVAAKLAGRPALPFMSSLGDLKSVLPSRYPVKTPAASANDPLEAAEIRILDNYTTGRVDPFSLVYHLFTFDGRLYLQFRYNVTRTSSALIEPWFDRLVSIVSRSAQSDS